MLSLNDAPNYSYMILALADARWRYTTRHPGVQRYPGVLRGASNGGTLSTDAITNIGFEVVGV